MNKKIVLVIIAVLAIVILVGIVSKSSSPANTVKSFYTEVNKGNTTEAAVKYFPDADINRLASLEGKIEKVKIMSEEIGTTGIEKGYAAVTARIILKDNAKKEACETRQIGGGIYTYSSVSDKYICYFREEKQILLEKTKSGWRIISEF